MRINTTLRDIANHVTIALRTVLREKVKGRRILLSKSTRYIRIEYKSSKEYSYAVFAMKTIFNLL